MSQLLKALISAGVPHATAVSALANVAEVGADGLFTQSGVAAAARNAIIAGLSRDNDQIPFGAYGDSIANFGAQPSPWDMQVVSAATSISDQKPGLWLRDLTRGRYRLVYNGGVSGDTTQMMIDRQSSTAGTNRKSLSDAAAAGVRLLWWSAGVNDFNAVTDTTTSAQIDAQVDSTVSNLQTLFAMSAALGIVNVWSDINGYAYNAVSAAHWPNRVECIRRLNAAVSTLLTNNPSLGFYVATRGLTTDATGAWLTGLDAGDGLHPGPNGSRVMIAPVAALMMQLAGSSFDRFALPRGTNLVSNPDFVASSAGVATGVTINDVGTISKTPQIVTWRGRRWQEVQWTTSGVDVNGSAGVFIQIAFDSSGLTVGDKIASELDVYVDDGNGGVPAVFQRAYRTRVNTTYLDAPVYDFSVAAANYTSNAVIDQKFSSQPIVCPTVTGTIGLFLGIYTKASPGTVRLRFSMPRVLKLRADY